MIHDVINCETFRVRTGTVEEVVVHPGFSVVTDNRYDRRFLDPIVEPEFGVRLTTKENHNRFMGFYEEDPPEAIDDMVTEFSVWSGVGRHIPGEKTWGAWANIGHLAEDECEGRFALISLINRNRDAFSAGFLGGLRNIVEMDVATGRQSQFLPTFSAYEVKDENNPDLASVSLVLVAENGFVTIRQHPSIPLLNAELIKVSYVPESEERLILEAA